MLSEDCNLIGTPEEIIAKIEHVQQKISLEYLIVHPQHGDKPPAEARKSLELFAKEVLPKVHAMATPLHEHSKGTDDSLLKRDPSEKVVLGGAVG